MITSVEVRRAERLSREQRAAAQPLLQIDRARATPRDLKIYDRAKTAVDFDKVLASKEVNDLCQSGVLFFAPESGVA